MIVIAKAQPAPAQLPWDDADAWSKHPDTALAGIRADSAAMISIPGDFRHFELDRLGNLFLIGSQGNQISEYNKEGEVLRRYDNARSYGQIAELDVTNPLKIAVYYRDYATIVVLDRYLTAINTVDLRKAGIWEAQTVATSYDNQYWVYDRQEATIKKIDGQARVSFVSSDLRQVFDAGVEPMELFDRDGLLYCYDPGFGWYIFDYYGALKQKVPVEELSDPAVTAGYLTGRKGQRLWLLRTGKKVDLAPFWRDLSSISTSGPIRQSLFDGASGTVWVLTDTGLTGYAIGRLAQ